MFDLNLKFIVELFSGLLTPVIAIITTYIAIQQFKTNRLKLRVELYPRQLEVYNSVTKIFAIVNQTGRLEYEEVFKFRRETDEKLFLFNRNVHQHIEQIYKKGIDFAAASEPGARINDSDCKKDHARKIELLHWFGEQSQVTEKLFRKYMSLIQ